MKNGGNIMADSGSFVWYVFVADLDATTRKAQELGGRVIQPPMSIGEMGRISMVQDDQGAVIGLFSTPEGA